MTENAANTPDSYNARNSTDGAHAQVAFILETLSKSPPSFQVLAGVMELISSADTVRIHQMTEHLGHVLGLPFTRKTICAAALLRLVASVPDVVGAQHCAAADQVLVSGMASSDIETRVFSTLVVLMCGAPPQSLLHLQESIRSDNLYIRSSAAAALSTMAGDHLQVMEQTTKGKGPHNIVSRAAPAQLLGVLREGLGVDNDGVKMCCAGALLKMFPDSTEVIRHVLQALAPTHRPYSYGVLVACSISGEVPTRVGPELLKIAGDATVPVPERCAALDIAARSNLANVALVPTLEAAMLSGNLMLMRAAVRGMRGKRHTDDRLVRALIAGVEAESVDTRIVALEGLSQMGALPTAAYEPLLQRLGKETSWDANKALCRSLAIGGDIVASELVALVTSDDYLVSLAARHTLREMGVAGARALVMAFRNETANDRVADAMVAVLGSVRASVSPLAMILAVELRQSRYYPRSVACVLGIDSVRCRDPIIAFPLAECMLYADDGVAACAASALRYIGAGVIPDINRILEQDTGGRRDRLEALLDEFGASGSRPQPAHSHMDERMKRLVTLGNDSAVRTLVHIVENADRTGRIGMYTLAKVLARRRASGQLPDDTPTSDQTLWNHITVLERHIGASLIVRKKNRRSAITDAATEWADVARRYCAWRA